MGNKIIISTPKSINEAHFQLYAKPICDIKNSTITRRPLIVVINQLISNITNLISNTDMKQNGHSTFN